MIPLLVWLAGCAFGLFVIMHYGFYRDMLALTTCGALLLWVIGGAAWIGKRLHAASGSRGTGKVHDPFIDAINNDPTVIAARKRVEELRSNVK